MICCYRFLEVAEWGDRREKCVFVQSLYIDNPDLEESTYTRVTILNREDVLPDSVRYFVNVHIVRHSYYSGWAYESEGEEYRSYSTAEDDPLNVHPFEVYDATLGTFGRLYNFIGKTADGKWFKSFYSEPASLSSSCRKTYQACLGYFSGFSRSSSDLKSNKRLIYYKKGTTEWGDDIDLYALTATKEVQNSNSFISIYPNPSSTNITIKNKDPNKNLNHIQVFNTLGQKLADWPSAHQEVLTKSVADFPIGTYWLLITDMDGDIWRMSFVRG